MLGKKNRNGWSQDVDAVHRLERLYENRFPPGYSYLTGSTLYSASVKSALSDHRRLVDFSHSFQQNNIRASGYAHAISYLAATFRSRESEN